MRKNSVALCEIGLRRSSVACVVSPCSSSSISIHWILRILGGYIRAQSVEWANIALGAIKGGIKRGATVLEACR